MNTKLNKKLIGILLSKQEIINVIIINLLGYVGNGSLTREGPGCPLLV